MDDPKIDPSIPPEYTTVAVIDLSFNGVHAANKVLPVDSMNITVMQFINTVKRTYKMGK